MKLDKYKNKSRGDRRVRQNKIRKHHEPRELTPPIICSSITKNNKSYNMCICGHITHCKIYHDETLSDTLDDYYLS